ncbi:MAG: hypothetical protein ACPGKS_08110 [Coraliomargarita sp.]
MPLPPSGPFEIPDASGHSIGLSRQPAKASNESGSDEYDEILDFSSASERLVTDEEGDDYEVAPVEVAVPVSEDALITLDAATAKLGPEILATLDAKFKGKLSEVRHLDGRDLIF